MNKKLIGAAAVLAVILGLGAALYFLNKPVEPDGGISSTPVEVLYVLGEAEAKPVKSVEVTNGHGTFTVNVEDPEASSLDRKYSIAGMEDLPATKSMLSSVADNGGKLIAKSVVSEGNAQFAAYGLDKPSATVNTLYADGSRAQLFIGNEAPGNEGYYVTSESGAVYLVNTSYVSNFLLPPLGFMDKTVTRGDPSADSFTFESAVLGGTVREEPIVIKSSAEGTEAETNFSTHRITRPMSVDFDTQYGTGALASVYGITATEVVDVAGTDGILEKYGLLEPYSTAQIVSGLEDVGSFTVSASEPDAEGMVYVHASTSKLIYRLPADSLGWLESQVHDLMSKLAIIPHIDKVSRVTVATAEKAWVFETAGEGDDLSVTCEGKEIPAANYRKFYQTLLAASLDSVPEEPLPDDAGPILTYTYEYRDGKPSDTVSFYEGPARKAYIRLNEGSAFLVAPTYLDKVLADLPKLLAGESVTSYL